MRKLGTLLLALVAVLFWVVPSFAGKVALTEDELDQLTAAGQPTVIQASAATNVVTLTDAMSAQLAIGAFGQTSLKALTVNNIVGENEVSTQGNVISENGAPSAGSQSNSINQSWGSVLDVGYLPVSSQGGGNGVANSVTKCVFGPCTQGGNSAKTSDKRLTKYADVIINAIASTSNVVTVTEIPQFELNIGGGSGCDTTGACTTPGGQSGLAALIVNNVVGRNLVANAVNIAAGAVDATTGIGAGGGFGFSASAAQSNIIKQYRGTPLGYTNRPTGN